MKVVVGLALAYCAFFIYMELRYAAPREPMTDEEWWENQW